MLYPLIILGLCLGSFANAFVWRVYEQAKPKHKRMSSDHDLSIVKGRSMCPNCYHILAWNDLIPVMSWIRLGGKCRYCHKAISWQYPLIELTTALLFVVSYASWPSQLNSLVSIVLFIFWLIFVVCFVALAIYDVRWMLLPDRIVRPLQVLALIDVFVQAMGSRHALLTLVTAFWGVICLAGLFYVLFQVSKGKWIGGGDVKLAVVLGLLVGGPLKAILVIFIASTLGSVIGVPILLKGTVRAKTRIPFGPFLIVATIIVYLFGTSLVVWYKRKLLLV